MVGVQDDHDCSGALRPGSYLADDCRIDRAALEKVDSVGEWVFLDAGSIVRPDVDIYSKNPTVPDQVEDGRRQDQRAAVRDAGLDD